MVSGRTGPNGPTARSHVVMAPETGPVYVKVHFIKGRNVKAPKTKPSLVIPFLVQVISSLSVCEILFCRSSAASFS